MPRKITVNPAKVHFKQHGQCEQGLTHLKNNNKKKDMHILQNVEVKKKKLNKSLRSPTI